MIEQLFGSKTRVKLLKLFFSNPNRSFYVREITRTIEEQINSVRRELANLLSMGLITSDSTTNRLYYEVNQDFEHYVSLRSMFSEAVDPIDETAIETDPKTTSKKKVSSKDKKQDPKTENVAADPPQDDTVELPEAKKWANAGNIAGIAYSGAYTRDEASGADIVVVGDVVPSKVDSVVSILEKEKKRELRYVVMDVSEWRYRSQVRDKFWLQFMGSKRQTILDKDNIFEDK